MYDPPRILVWAFANERTGASSLLRVLKLARIARALGLAVFQLEGRPITVYEKIAFWGGLAVTVIVSVLLAIVAKRAIGKALAEVNRKAELEK